MTDLEGNTLNENEIAKDMAMRAIASSINELERLSGLISERDANAISGFSRELGSLAWQLSKVNR